MSPGASASNPSFKRTPSGAASTPSGCRPTENYWLLVGQSGTVIETINANERVLVQFDRMVSERGLACHNFPKKRQETDRFAGPCPCFQEQD